jgi:hypothetical protein
MYIIDVQNDIEKNADEGEGERFLRKVEVFYVPILTIPMIAGINKTIHSPSHIWK